MAAKQKTGNNQLGMTLLKGRTFFVLILLLIFFSITANNFLSASSLLSVAYRFQAVYVKFIGTHAEYDLIDAETVEMES